MAVQDMTTERRKLQFIITLPRSSQVPAWRAANPALAAEVERWRTDVRRTAKFTAETVSEALTYIDDKALLESIEANERRNGIRSDARSRIWDLQRAAAAASREAEPDTKVTFTNELFRGEIREVAEKLKFIPMHRVCHGTLQQWLKGLSNEDLEAVWSVAQPQAFLVTEMLDRKMLKQLETSLKGGSVTSVAVPLRSMVEADADIARFALSMGLTSGVIAQCRWTDDALAVLRENRQYPAMLLMRQMTMHDVLSHAGALTMSELEAITGMDLSPREVLALHDEIIRLEAAHGSVPPTVVYRLERAGEVTPPLREVYVRNCEPQRILSVLVEVGDEERERLISIVAGHRPDAFERMFGFLNNTDETMSSVALFERLLPETGANVLALSGGRGWVARRIAEKIAEELSDDDWGVFFAVAAGFPGTVAELIDTVKTLQQS